jgi:branched-chain amino acid transport system ATP-binding protein
MPDFILKTTALRKTFGGLVAVNDLDFEVEKREIRGLIGPNGSGKTTFFNLISGFHVPSSGSVAFEGKEITGWKPHAIAALGVVRTFQTTILFNEMTVLENVYCGFYLSFRSGLLPTVLYSRSSRREAQRINHNAMELLGYMKIEGLSNELAKNLPHGHQRRLAIAIGLAASPKLLLLDETLTGMNEKETGEMVEQIRKIRKDLDTTIIIIEHNMKAIIDLSDKLTVLNYGTKIAEGPPKTVVQNQEVIDAYLGSDEENSHVL